MIHHNFDYTSGIPDYVGDRYYGQDRARDFWSLLNFVGQMGRNILGAGFVSIEGVITEGTAATDLNIPVAKGFVDYIVTLPDDYTSLPPTIRTEALPVFIKTTAQLDFSFSGTATLDGSTVNYIKVRYTETDGATRSKVKAAGTYVYEKEPSFTITVDSTAPTSADLVLGTVVSDGATTTIVQNNNSSGETSKFLGELFYLDEYYEPSESFPALCLNDIDGQIDISETNWPLAIQHLRNKQAYYLRGRSGEKGFFNVTNWAIASNVGTLTYANTAAENAMLTILEQDQAFHGSYANWRTVTLTQAIGNIPAGDYAITNVDTGTRQITFAVIAADSSASITAASFFYPHRIAGSTTTARIFEADDLALISEAGDGSVISGYRHLDTFQDHIHNERSIDGTDNTVVSARATGSSANGPRAGYGTVTTDSQTETTGAATDNSGSLGTPRAGTKTKNRGMGAFLYWWGKRYDN